MTVHAAPSDPSGLAWEGHNSAARPTFAHHDETKAINAKDSVDHLLELAYRSCFGHGGDLNGLRKEAEVLGWQTVPDTELMRNETNISQMRGGWLFSNEFGSYAVIQSILKSDPGTSVCSITTQLSDPGLHPRIKAKFLVRFNTTIAEEVDGPAEHVDRFWLNRAHKTPIKASMRFVRSSGSLTIRMIHGNARPTGA
ncbi:MAG: hypothetical protein ACKVP4_05375 [Hyphomicrobium sp.]